MARELSALAAWVRRRSGDVDRAKEKIDALPPSETHKGRRLVPFPFAIVDTVKAKYSNEQINAAIDKAPIKSITLKGLHSFQHSVRPERVAQYIEHPNLIPKGQTHAKHGGIVDAPIVVIVDKQRYVWDGNHRLTADYLEGASTASVRLVDLDAVENE